MQFGMRTSIINLEKRVIKLIAGLLTQDSYRMAYTDLKIGTKVFLYIFEIIFYKISSYQNKPEFNGLNITNSIDMIMYLHHLNLFDKKCSDKRNF